MAQNHKTGGVVFGSEERKQGIVNNLENDITEAKESKGEECLSKVVAKNETDDAAKHNG